MTTYLKNKRITTFLGWLWSFGFYITEDHVRYLESIAADGKVIVTSVAWFSVWKWGSIRNLGRRSFQEAEALKFEITRTLYKLLHCSDFVYLSQTRGHKYKLLKHRINSSVRYIFYRARS